MASTAAIFILIISLMGCRSKLIIEEETRLPIHADNTDGDKFSEKKLYDVQLDDLNKRLTANEALLSELEKKYSHLAIKFLEAELLSLNKHVKINEKVEQNCKEINSPNMNSAEFDKKVTSVEVGLKSLNGDFADLRKNYSSCCTTAGTSTQVDDVVESKVPRKDCSGIMKGGNVSSGVRTIYPFVDVSQGVDVYCEQNYSGGGWTVIQRRDADLEVREPFFRGWTQYEDGFGQRTGEYWLGLKAIHSLTASNSLELRIRLEAFDGTKAYASYKTFKVGNSNGNYKLDIGQYTGDAGDSTMRFHNGKMFSTFDRDNDGGNVHCAVADQGAWWFDGPCSYSNNLNGPAVKGQHSYNLIYWIDFKYMQALKKVTMMVRPIGH